MVADIIFILEIQIKSPIGDPGVLYDTREGLKTVCKKEHHIRASDSRYCLKICFTVSYRCGFSSSRETGWSYSTAL